MKIITLSAKAQNGKDFTANIIKRQLELKNKKVLICHYADLLKYMCKTFFDWDGNKDEKGRTILQYVGTDVVRKKKPNFWVDFILDTLDMFEENWDYVLIPDTRFPNENDKLKETGKEVYTVRITRPFFNSGLTEEQMKHESETALDNYNFDFYLTNITESFLTDQVISMLREIESSEVVNGN